ncbi:MAG: DUF2231 domain-containing protein [Acidimicrobiia bacterium]
MRRFSFRPSLTLRGREFKGLRGFAGKPFHPPLTDVPVGAYILAPAFDVISTIGGADNRWATDFYRAATFVLIGGALVSLLAALTGFWDWLRSTEPGNQARRTANAHMTVMLVLTTVVIVDIVLRLANYDDPHTPVAVLILSLIAAVLVTVGGTIGGGLAFDYGFNVETAGDSPVWHESETDVMPGGKAAAGR